MGNVDWKSLEGKYFKVDVGSTTAEALSGGDNSVIYYTTDGNVVLNGQVFGGGCLDLGLVSSDDAGCAEAAKSEVAGNRQITMIRFRVRGVTSEKVTVIWQWCNGVDVCAQLKFVDKSVWRRNVTGATGVAGATTSASQWERTWAHYLGYDAANRKIQLKDYNQTVFRDVQLPLATESQAGLMSGEDKEILDAIQWCHCEFAPPYFAPNGFNICVNDRYGDGVDSVVIPYATLDSDGLMSVGDKTLIDEQLVRSIEFRSEEQGPGQLSLVCFNSLGEDIGSIDLPFADGVTPGILSNDSWYSFYQTYKKCARTIGYDSSTRKLYLKDVEDNTRSSVILPEATRSQAGLMSADDKKNLNEYLVSSIKIYQVDGPSNKGVYINLVALNGDEYDDGPCIEYATSTKPGVMSAADKAKLDMRANVREKCYGFNVKGVTNGATYDASAVPWSQADMKAWSKSNGIFPLFFIPGSGGGNMYRPVAVEVYAASTKMVFVFDTGIVVQNWQYNAATSKWTVTVTTL